MLGFSCFLLVTFIATALWLRRAPSTPLRAGRSTALHSTSSGQVTAGQARTFPWIITAVVAGLLLLAGILLWPGTLVLSRGLTKLANPFGLLWLSLLALTLRAWHQRTVDGRQWTVDSGGKTGVRGPARNRPWTLSMAALLVLMTVGANNGTAYLLMRWWQHPFASIQPMDQAPFDIVFVLGGGTGLGFNGNLQLNGSGDRVMLAARLYHAGRTPLLGCTGRRTGEWTDESHDPATQTIAILTQIGIPKDRIIRLTGRNTQEEMVAIREAVRARGWDRIGLITSAWHLRRAMRLALKQQVYPQPLPADVRGQLHHWQDWSIVPDADALMDVTLLCKEWLAAVVGR